MKKLVIFTSFIVCFISSFGQPEIRRSSPVNTPVDPNLFTTNSFRLPIFNDTLSANAVTSLDSAGKLIFTRDVMAPWVRRHSPKRWDRVILGTAGDFIQNQFVAAQTPANYWISGNARIDGYQQFGTVGRIQDDGGTISITNTNPVITGANLRVQKLLFYDENNPTNFANTSIYSNGSTRLDIVSNFAANSRIVFITPFIAQTQPITWNLGNQRPLVFGNITEGSFNGDEVINIWNAGDLDPGEEAFRGIRSQIGFSSTINDRGRFTIAKIGSEATDTTAAGFAGDLVFYTSNVIIGNGVPREQMRISSLGELKLDAYPSTRNNGVLTKVLGTDASGNVILGTVSAGGVTSIPPNIGSGHRIFSPQIPGFKTLFGSYGLDLDSTTNANAITFKIDSSRWATQNDISIFLDGTDTVSLSNRINLKVDTVYRVNDSTIAQVINGRVTTFEIKGGVQGGGGGASGITSINTLTDAVQTFAFDETGLTPGVSSASAVHTFHHPLASAAGVTNGGITKVDYDLFFAKQPPGNYITALSGDVVAFGPGSVSSTIQANVVSDAKIRQSAGLSVIGRASNTTGDVADITAATDNTIMRRSGTSIGFGQINNLFMDTTSVVTGVATQNDLLNFGLQDAITNDNVLTKKDTILAKGYKLIIAGRDSWLGNQQEYSNASIDLQAPLTIGLLDSSKWIGGGSTFGYFPAAGLFVDRTIRYTDIVRSQTESSKHGFAVMFRNQIADSAIINTANGDLYEGIFSRMEYAQLSGYTGRSVVTQSSLVPGFAPAALLGINYVHGGGSATDNMYLQGWFAAVTGHLLMTANFDTVENYISFLATPGETNGRVLHKYDFFSNSNIATGVVQDLYSFYGVSNDGKMFNAGDVLFGRVTAESYYDAPVASAKFEIRSTTKGMLIMRMTGAQQNAISSPATGLMIYNTDSLSHTFYNGTAWRKMSSGGTSTSDVLVPVGTNFKIAIANTLNVKGLLAGLYTNIDSATTNSVKIGVDSASLASYIRSTIPASAGTPISSLLAATGTNSIGIGNFGQTWTMTATSASTIGFTLARSGTLGTVLQVNGTTKLLDSLSLFNVGTATAGDSLITKTTSGLIKKTADIPFNFLSNPTALPDQINFGGNYIDWINLPLLQLGLTTTNGNGLVATSTTLTSGGLLRVFVNSIAAASNTQIAADIATQGANATTTQTTYALRATNIHSGTASTNIAGYFSSSTATNNYAIIVPSGGGRVGLGTITPAASAMLDMTTTTQGLLVPRMTTTQQDAISSPATGLLIFNTDSVKFRFYNSSVWVSIGTGSGGGGGSGTVTNVTGTSPIVITGTSTITPNVTILNAAADATTKGAATFLAADFIDNGSGLISIDYVNGQMASATLNGFTSTTTQTFAGDKTYSGFSTINGFKTNTTATNSNFNIMSNGGTTATLTQLIFAGSSTVEMRAYARGSGTLSVAAGRSAAHWVFGDQSLTEAASSTHALFAGMFFKSQTFTNGAGATANLATVAIEGAPTGITPTDRTVPLWVMSGALRMGQAGTAQGSFIIEGSTSGAITVQTAAIAGTWTLTLPTAYPAVNGYVLSGNTDGTTQWVSQTVITANGGLSMSTATNVKLGGSALTANASILTSAFNLSITSTNATSTLSVDNTSAGNDQGIIVTAVGGAAIVATSTNNDAIFATSTNGSGAEFISTNASGIEVTSTAGQAAQFFINPSSTNTTVTAITISRQSSGTAANSIGGSIDFAVETVGGTSAIANRFISTLTTAATATATSQFILSGILSGSAVNLLTIDAIGTYTFAGTATQAGEIRFYEDTDFGTNYTAFKTGAAQSANLTYTWPSAYPTASTWVLTSSTAGALAWADVFSISKPRIGGGTTSATPTPDWDTQDDYILTSLSSNATFGVPTGTPVQAQEIIVRITCDGTNRNLSFNAIYRGSTDIPLPTQILANTTMYMKFKYNTTVSRVDMVALSSGY